MVFWQKNQMRYQRTDIVTYGVMTEMTKTGQFIAAWVFELWILKNGRTKPSWLTVRPFCVMEEDKNEYIFSSRRMTATTPKTIPTTRRKMMMMMITTTTMTWTRQKTVPLSLSTGKDAIALTRGTLVRHRSPSPRVDLPVGKKRRKKKWRRN